MKNDDSGPAFPRARNAVPGMKTIDEGTPGMSLRDYFIAHAPVEPQTWFEPIMDRFRPKYLPENRVLINEWDDDYNKQRYIQWPAAWADEMLKARSK